MNTITVTVPFTAENLEILKQLTGESPKLAATVATENKKPADSVNKLPRKEEPAPANPTKTEPAKSETAEKVTKTDVRAIALKLSKAGKQAELQEIFKEFNAEKLSEIPETDYSALKARLEETAVKLNA